VQTLKTKTYKKAVEWIAINDEPSETDLEEISGFLTVTLIADLFNIDEQVVAKDVLKIREKL
jgi:predicted P-loop ATPase/GTPase